MVTLQSRLQGESNAKLPCLGKRWAKLTAITPFYIDDYWSQYQTNRRQAVADLTQDIEKALKITIIKASSE